MTRYILRRLLLATPALFASSVLIFVLMRMVPGDAALLKVYANGDVPGDSPAYAAARAELGLDRPYVVQYTDWI